MERRVDRASRQSRNHTEMRGRADVKQTLEREGREYRARTDERLSREEEDDWSGEWRPRTREGEVRNVKEGRATCNTPTG